MHRSRSFGRSSGWLGLVVVAAVSLTAGTCPPTEERARPYVLSYIDTSFRQRLRWSADGLTWATPTAAVPTADRAAGIAANERLLYLGVFENGTSDLHFMMGLGPDTWDSSPTRVGNGHRPAVHSGPSVTHLEDTRWLVAFRNQNQQADVHVFNTATGVRDLESEVTPGAGVTNNSVEDGPLIVNRNGRVLVSWLRATHELWMVPGDVQNGVPVWQAGYRFDANVPEPGFHQPEFGHGLAHDGDRFYAAVVRQRVPQPGEQLQRHFLFIYTSQDAINWTRLTSREAFIPTSMSMAARAPNDLIAILSRTTTSLVNERVFRFDGSSWSFLDNNDVFGNVGMNSGHDFTLYAPE